MNSYTNGRGRNQPGHAPELHVAARNSSNALNLGSRVPITERARSRGWMRINSGKISSLMSWIDRSLIARGTDWFYFSFNIFFFFFLPLFWSLIDGGGLIKRKTNGRWKELMHLSCFAFPIFALFIWEIGRGSLTAWLARLKGIWIWFCGYITVYQNLNNNNNKLSLSDITDLKKFRESLDEWAY